MFSLCYVQVSPAIINAKKWIFEIPPKHVHHVNLVSLETAVFPVYYSNLLYVNR